MGCMAIFAIPSAGVSFFFSAWVLMLFAGVINPWLGLKTVSYVESMVITIALWIVVAPLVAAVAGSRRRR
jgi:hypothetical protein